MTMHISSSKKRAIHTFTMWTSNMNIAAISSVFPQLFWSFPELQ